MYNRHICFPSSPVSAPNQTPFWSSNLNGRSLFCHLRQTDNLSLGTGVSYRANGGNRPTVAIRQSENIKYGRSLK